MVGPIIYIYIQIEAKANNHKKGSKPSNIRAVKAEAYFTGKENCILVARRLGFLIWIGISLAMGLISCNGQISENQWEYIMIDWFLGGVPEMHFPQRVDPRTSENGFCIRLAMFGRTFVVVRHRVSCFIAGRVSFLSFTHLPRRPIVLTAIFSYCI